MRDRPPSVDFGRDSEGESAVDISPDQGDNVGASGSNQERFGVLSGGGAKSIEPSFSPQE